MQPYRKTYLPRTNQAWVDYMLKRMRLLCKYRKQISANDLYDIIQSAPVTTPDYRAVAGLFIRLETQGWIERTNQRIKSKVGHGTQLVVWRTLK